MDTNSLNDRLISRPDGFLEKNIEERLIQLREGRTWQAKVYSLRGFSGNSPDFTTEQEADAWIASQKKLHGNKYDFEKISYDYSGLTKESEETDRGSKKRYYAGYETAKSDKEKGRKTTILSKDNPSWVRGYQDFMGGKSPEVKSPLEFLETHEGFHEGDRVEWTVGDQHVTGTVVDFAWLTIRVKLDHDVRHLQTGEIIKGGSIVSVADRNLTVIHESGLPKGEFWRQQGKTPWGAKVKGSEKKKKPFKSAYSALTPDQKKQFNSKMKLHYIKSTLRKEDVSEDEKYVNCAICGGHVKKGEKVCPNCGEKAPYMREGNEPVDEASISDVPTENASPYVKAAITKCLGKVFHYTGGTRRYVCAKVHIYGIQEGNPDYIIGMDLVALSGSEKGCNPTNDTVKDIGNKWLIDQNQSVVFKGKLAYKLAAMYKFKALFALKPSGWSDTGIGSLMAFAIGAAAAGVAPASPTVTQEAVYARLDKGCLSETADTGAIRRIQDLKAASIGSEEWEELKRVLQDDLRSGMLSKDMERRVRDVLGASEKRLATRPDFEEVQEVADRLERALRKGTVQ